MLRVIVLISIASIRVVGVPFFLLKKKAHKVLALGPALINVQTSGARPPANTPLHLASKVGHDRAICCFYSLGD